MKKIYLYNIIDKYGAILIYTEKKYSDFEVLNYLKEWQKEINAIRVKLETEEDKLNNILDKKIEEYIEKKTGGISQDEVIFSLRKEFGDHYDFQKYDNNEISSDALINIYYYEYFTRDYGISTREQALCFNLDTTNLNNISEEFIAITHTDKYGPLYIINCNSIYYNGDLSMGGFNTGNEVELIILD